MNGRDLIQKIEKLMDLYGEQLEFFAHGPSSEFFPSGYGPEINWAAAKIELNYQVGDSPETIMACFFYGLPIPLQGGPLQYPVKTAEVPFSPHKWKEL